MTLLNFLENLWSGRALHSSVGPNGRAVTPLFWTFGKGEFGSDVRCTIPLDRMREVSSLIDDKCGQNLRRKRAILKCFCYAKAVNRVMFVFRESLASQRPHRGRDFVGLPVRACCASSP